MQLFKLKKHNYSLTAVLLFLSFSGAHAHGFTLFFTPYSIDASEYVHEDAETTAESTVSLNKTADEAADDTTDDTAENTTDEAAGDTEEEAPDETTEETDATASDENNIAPDIDLKEITLPPVVVVQQPASSETGKPAIEDESISEETALDGHKEAPLSAQPLELLDSTILPGTSTRLAWNPEISFSGLSLSTPVLVINGKKPGPVLCLTAAVHGDELNGIEVVRTVMYEVDPQKLSGAIIGVPIVNLQGFQRNTRYMSDRRDLNRFFPGNLDGSLASRVAYSLFTNIITQCDLLVDIHTGSFKRTNLAQVRADMSDPDVVEFTEGFDEMVVVHSKGSSGMLRYEAHKIGIKSVTFELGESSRLQKEQVDSGVNGIYGLLKKQNMYSKFFDWGSPSPVYFDSKWLRVSSAGILFSKVKLGDDVRKGALLGTVTDPITNESVEVSSTIDGKIIGMATNQVVMPGFAAYHIGIKASEEELMEMAEDSVFSPDTPLPES